MSTRIDRRFSALKQEGRPALVTFVTAGDPDLETSAKSGVNVDEGFTELTRRIIDTRTGG